MSLSKKKNQKRICCNKNFFVIYLNAG